MTPGLYALAAIVASVVLAWLKGRHSGRKSARDRAKLEALERIQDGLDAAGKAASSGKSPEQIAREGDGKWL